MTVVHFCVVFVLIYGFGPKTWNLSKKKKHKKQLNWECYLARIYI